MKKQKRTCYEIQDLNNNVGNIDEIIKKSEQSYTKSIQKVVSTLIDNNCKMILLSGPSASGKTTTSKLIGEELLKHNIGSLVVSIDDFFIALKNVPKLEDGRPDMENIAHIDIKTFKKFYSSILKKGKAKMPRYDFLKQERAGYETVKIDKNDVVIVEGTHALNPILKPNSKFDDKILRVYVCVNSVFSNNGEVTINERDLRLMRRSYRDAFTRNLTPEYTFEQWKHICSGEDLYIAPFKDSADIVIDTTRNYEIMVFAKYLPDLLKPYTDIPKMTEIASKLKPVKKIDKKLIPANSMLLEFMVGKE